MNLRYLYHIARAGTLRGAYWHLLRTREKQVKLGRLEHGAFSRHIASENVHLRTNIGRPAADRVDDETRLAAAVAWVLRAQAATPDAGVSFGYFPLDRGWRPSYPETTGYLITSLLAYAATHPRPDVRDAALAMAHWEVDVQMPNGAVQGGPVVSPENQTPAAFNTGMVLDGLCSAYEANREERFLNAAAAAARFLVSDLDDAGYFRTSGAFVSQGDTKTYNCLCAWSMLRLGLLTGDRALKSVAIRAVEAALVRQQANGWFTNNSLDIATIALTHTIGYTLQGVFEVGVLAEREDFIAAARRGLAAVLRKQRPDGFLAARFDKAWNGAADFVCLTGSCQLAVIAYRFAEVLHDRELVPLADRALGFVAATQRLESDDSNLIGAIAGSYPITGDYMWASFPNWATKYFIDALLLRRRLSQSLSAPTN